MFPIIPPACHKGARYYQITRTRTGGRMPSSTTDEGGSTSTTDARVSPAEAEPAVLSAFHAAASQQLKRLMADGVQRDTASVQLMDKMLQHGAGEAAGLPGVLENIKCTSPQLQHVVSKICEEHPPARARQHWTEQPRPRAQLHHRR